jgi:ubiquinone/menaquinone biosynthesis C-methylase UbiE
LTELFYRFYWWLQRWIAPGLRYCLEEYEDALAESVKRETRWLDLGCGHNLLPQWRAEQEQALTRRPAQLVGLDYDMPSLRNHHSISQLVRGDISRLPFRDGSFNLVSSSMVFEHLKHPRAQLEEISRVMNPGGELIFLTPNAMGYTTLLGRIAPESVKGRLIRFFHGREEHDVFPTFYRINSPGQIARALRESGFEAREIRLIPSAAQFMKIPPLVFFELLWIRLTMTKRLEALRTNLIVRCVKPAEKPAGPIAAS